MSWIRLVLMVILWSLAGMGTAHADPPSRVVVLADSRWTPATTDALAVELTARAIDFELVEVADGQAITARELIASGAACVVIWVEPDRDAGTVMVLGADAGVRRANLTAPLGAVSPRVFALIAASLAAETLSPPHPLGDVSVDVDVTVASDANVTDLAGPAEPADLAEPAEPATALPDSPLAAPLSPPSVAAMTGPAIAMTGHSGGRAGRWFVEAGGVSALVSSGVMVGIGRHLTDTIRLHLIGDLVYVIPAEEQALLLGVAVSRSPARRGFQIGGSLGWVTMPDANGFAAGPWLGWRWPLGSRAALDARLAIEVGTMDGQSFFPVPLGTLAVELPL